MNVPKGCRAEMDEPRKDAGSPPLLRPKSALAALLDFFGLKQEPFGVTPDPSFLYFSPTHREALASMTYGIEAGRGFLALIAKPGMGKTTLLFHLLEHFRNSARSALLFQTQCSSREFMHLLMSELGYETAGYDFVRMHETFNQHLLQEARAGNRCIIIIDEAQNLDGSVLETIRLLSNFETPRAKLLQIILAGQPELADRLSSNSMVQLRQRLSLVNGLEPFSAYETERYILHRLRTSGYSGELPLTPGALALATKFSAGIPRSINTFCFNALTLAFALRRTVIDTEIAREVINDLELSGKKLGSNAVEQAKLTDNNPEATGPTSAFTAMPNTNGKKEAMMGHSGPYEGVAGQAFDKLNVSTPSALDDANGKGNGDNPLQFPRPFVSMPKSSDCDGINSRSAPDKLVSLAQASAYMSSIVRSLKSGRS
jgi:type II secretory pathway predicted ATPase ExeA